MFFYWASMIAFFVYLYIPTFKWMYGRYTAVDTYYSHGFLVPFVSGILIWQKRKTIEQLPFDYTWWGFALIVIALLLHIASSIFYVFFTSGFSIFLFILGMFLFIFGKTMTEKLLFPLLFLLFMFPIPQNVVAAISFPMKMKVARMGSSLAGYLGIPVFNSGFYIDTAGGLLLIDEPCSGLRSLIAFVAVGAILAYKSDTTMNGKVTLFALAVPISFITNILRVTFLVVIASRYGVDAAGPDSWAHELSGYFIFIFGISALIILKRVFEWKR